MTDSSLPEYSADSLGGHPYTVENRRGGLTGNLWRIALVIGVGQFSMSVWTWQFSIFMEAIELLGWQIGVTFTAGTLASLIGTAMSGYISDFIGRRKTLLFAYIPMGIGIFLLFIYPVWPLFPFLYGLIQFGWIFVVIMARAAPADQIAQDKGRDAAKTFSMMLLPAFAIDGLSPLLASVLLFSGFPQRDLLVLGGIGTILAFIVSARFVHETLRDEIREKAKSGPMITLRGLGRDFWILSAGISGYSFAFGMSFPYLGNLVVNEWHVSAAYWGLIWSASSLLIAALSYSGGKLADTRIKVSFSTAMIAFTMIMFGLALGTGFEFLLVLNLIWSLPLVIWISAEKALVVQGVNEEMKGRAFSTYQFVISAIQIIALNVGAFLWEFYGNLRVVWTIASIIAAVSLFPALLAVRAIELKSEESAVSEETQSTEE